MPKERLKITQPLCVTAKFMLDRGAGAAETAKLLEISNSTLTRIQAAGFDAEKYAQLLADRRAEDQRKREELKEALKPRPEKLTDEKFKELLAMSHPEELQGQISMDLTGTEEKQPAEEQTEIPPFYNWIERTIYDNTMKIVTAQYGSVQKSETKLEMKLDKIYDMLGQILRAIRKE